MKNKKEKKRLFSVPDCAGETVAARGAVGRLGRTRCWNRNFIVMVSLQIWPSLKNNIRNHCEAKLLCVDRSSFSSLAIEEESLSKHYFIQGAVFIVHSYS